MYSFVRNEIIRGKMDLLEERLREVTAIGDMKAVKEVIELGVDVNSRNSVNGWTALHWACKRNFPDIVLLLLQCGADKKIVTNNGETPASLCTNSSILQMLGVSTEACQIFTPKEETINFIPNYIKNPPLSLNAEIQRYKSDTTNFSSSSNHIINKDLILKIRVANTPDPDFIEIEMPKKTLTYYNLVQRCCEELNIVTEILKIRKLPNTKLRNDKDVQRLTDFQEIEVVINDVSGSKQNANGKAVSVTPTNNYQSISKKDQTILY